MQLTPKINIYNSDCLDAMKAMPDNAYDLAIVDPPYGIDDKLYRSSYGGCVGGLTKYAENRWDKETPTNKYFMELIRVSKEQIVWGGNYFPILWNKGCRGLITWDKMVYLTTMSQIEYAWYSKDKLPQLVKINNNDSNRIHPTQKPVKLYEWLLDNYAKEGDRILDTHLGSGSIAIACHNRGFQLDGYEIDKDYFEATSKRIKDHIAQLTLF
jgi:site-specific DNA-methyltransferase (adenine-specific)